MPRIVHARIDEGTARTLKRLEQRLGWTDSKVVREGIKALGGLYLRSRERPIIGLGKFASGLPDLASNKRHLRGFGR
jgi:hypothetical protein